MVDRPDKLVASLPESDQRHARERRQCEFKTLALRLQQLLPLPLLFLFRQMAPVLMADRDQHVLMHLLTRALQAFPGETGPQDRVAFGYVLPCLAGKAFVDFLAPLTDQL